MARIESESLGFLELLENNNHRDWFKSNRSLYDQAHNNVIEFANELLERLQQHDEIETENGKKSLYRIYRDVRFSKDKTPYNKHFSGGFVRAGKSRRGGYYFRIEKGNSLVAGGFWGPNKEDLYRIRKEIEQDGDTFRSIVSDTAITDVFGTLHGSQLKTVPRGFQKDDSNIDLLRYKQFILYRTFTDKEVLSASFIEKVDRSFRALRPFFDYMSLILTTDLNGEPIHD